MKKSSLSLDFTSLLIAVTDPNYLLLFYFQIWFTNDWAFIIAFAILAFSDGYILNNTLMFGPKVSPPEFQALTTSMIVASQPISIMIAALLSNVIVKIL